MATKKSGLKLYAHLHGNQIIDLVWAKSKKWVEKEYLGGQYAIGEKVERIKLRKKTKPGRMNFYKPQNTPKPENPSRYPDITKDKEEINK